MLIRELEEKDNYQIEKLVKESLESFGLNREGTAYYDPELPRLSKYYSSIQDASYWVACEGEEVIGGIGIAPFVNEKGICELQKFYVRHDQQGKGVGRDLLDTALEFAKPKYNQCYLETRHELVQANKLYERNGFSLLSSPIEGSEHSFMDRWYIIDL